MGRGGEGGKWEGDQLVRRKRMSLLLGEGEVPEARSLAPIDFIQMHILCGESDDFICELTGWGPLMGLKCSFILPKTPACQHANSHICTGAPTISCRLCF